MKLLFIRHGDPDYEKDSLTEKGWHEAELLGQRMANTPVTAFYVSPLGRAKDTASKTLQKAEMPQNWRGCGNFTHPFRIFTPANQELPGISSRQTGPQSRSITTRHAGRKPCPCCRVT